VSPYSRLFLSKHFASFFHTTPRRNQNGRARPQDKFFSPFSLGAVESIHSQRMNSATKTSNNSSNLIGIHGYNLVGCWDRIHCEKAFKIASEIGYSLVEVPVIDPLFDTQATKQLADKYGLRLSCSVGLSQDTDISSLDESTRKQGEQVLMTAVERAHAIGSPIVCGVIYSKLGKYSRAATQQNVNNSVEILRRVAQKAQSLGVQLGLEVCNKYETNLINTAGDAMKMIQRIGMPNVVVHLDAYHMNSKCVQSS